jgi:hypothetical protein
VIDIAIGAAPALGVSTLSELIVLAKKALELASRGVLLRNGEVVFAGTANELCGSEAVAAAYLGEAARHTAPLV